MNYSNFVQYIVNITMHNPRIAHPAIYPFLSPSYWAVFVCRARNCCTTWSLLQSFRRLKKRRKGTKHDTVSFLNNNHWAKSKKSIWSSVNNNIFISRSPYKTMFKTAGHIGWHLDFPVCIIVATFQLFYQCHGQILKAPSHPVAGKNPIMAARWKQPKKTLGIVAKGPS